MPISKGFRLFEEAENGRVSFGLRLWKSRRSVQDDDIL
jgi:hypothetical protein